MTAIVPMLNRRNLLAATAGVAITGFPAGRAAATSQYETDLTALRGSINATELGVTGDTSSDQSQAFAEMLRKAAEGDLRGTRLVRQFGGLAKVDRVGFYAANCSIISAVAWTSSGVLPSKVEWGRCRL